VLRRQREIEKLPSLSGRDRDQTTIALAITCKADRPGGERGKCACSPPAAGLLWLIRACWLLAVAIENRLGAPTLRKWRLYDMADLRKLHGCIISLRVGRQLTPDLDACPI
jgi:hypothetical protein